MRNQQVPVLLGLRNIVAQNDILCHVKPCAKYHFALRDWSTVWRPDSRSVADIVVQIAVFQLYNAIHDTVQKVW